MADYCRTQRQARTLSLRRLAALLGYRNLNKGMRRLRRLEQDGVAPLDLLRKLVQALDLDEALIRHLAAQDEQERLCDWQAWADTPVPLRLLLRLAPAVYAAEPVPPEVTQEHAEAWACTVAATRRVPACLVVSRRHSVWIDAQGRVTGRTEARPGVSHTPYLQVGGRPVLLDLNRVEPPDTASAP